MCFVNASLGFAVCNSAKLLKTTDGGNSWSEVTTFPAMTNNLVDVQFLSSTTGYVLTYKDVFADGSVYKTTDGGTTWSQILLGGNFDAAAINFPTVNCGYIAGSTAIFKTSDAGANWFAVTDPSYNCDPYKIAFATPDTGLVTDYFNGYTYFTTDGGNTWTDQYNHIVTYASQIKFISKTEGLATGTGTIYRTSDKGVTWTTVNSSTTETEFMLSGVDATTSLGFAVGDMSIFVSKNKGTTWEYRFTQKGINLDDWLTDVHVLNSTTAIASSKSGIFYKMEIVEQ